MPQTMQGSLPLPRLQRTSAGYRLQAGDFTMATITRDGRRFRLQWSDKPESEGFESLRHLRAWIAFCFGE